MNGHDLISDARRTVDSSARSSRTRTLPVASRRLGAAVLASPRRSAARHADYPAAAIGRAPRWASVGDVLLAHDDQRRRARPRGKRSEVRLPDLVEEVEDVSRPAAELLDNCGGKQAHNAVVEGAERDGPEASVGAQHERGDPFAMSSGDLQRNHASPTMADQHRSIAGGG